MFRRSKKKKKKVKLYPHKNGLWVMLVDTIRSCAEQIFSQLDFLPAFQRGDTRSSGVLRTTFRDISVLLFQAYESHASYHTCIHRRVCTEKVTFLGINNCDDFVVHSILIDCIKLIIYMSFFEANRFLDLIRAV